jgi:UDP-4-amino-4,6-dideoxy-N-acetyl-beta-L-altrosamine N-acetyltransferase
MTKDAPQDLSQPKRNPLVTGWNKIRLTPLEDSDIDSLYAWQNSPSLRDLSMGFRFPIQRETVKEWIKNIREQNSKSRVVFAIRNHSAFLGTVSLHAIDPYQRKALLGICVGDRSERNKGIGFISTSLVLDYAFNALDFRKVSLEVISTNLSAIALYENLGFVREGAKREEYFLDGKCIDVYVYGILRREFNVVLPQNAHRLIHGF